MTTIDTLRKALEAAEPVAFMWQHDETGRIGFIDPWQRQNGFEANNPRCKIVATLHTAPIAPAAAGPAAETMEQKNARNARVQTRYDELMQAGKHGHYETMFRVVREEVERARTAPIAPAIPALTTDELDARFKAMPEVVAPDVIAYVAGATWAYDLAAERAGVQIK